MMEETDAQSPEEMAAAAAKALENLYLLLRFDMGLPTVPIISGFHAQIATMMTQLMGGEMAEQMMVNAGARVRHLPPIDQVLADPIGPTVGRA